VHVLIVEDDAALRDFLGKGLRLDGHDVAVVEDGEAALESVARRRPDLMILDLGLPRKDGMEVLAEMSERYGSTSVLVLTGRSGMEERVQCLELGADDIVLKPFSFHELRARLNAVWRRRRQAEDPVLRFGNLEMDRAERTVTQAGCEVDLTATEFSLLESLLRRGGDRVSSRAELLREVWQTTAGAETGGAGPHADGTRGAGAGTGTGTNIVEVYINYLRKKLGRKAAGGRDGQSVIRTVRGEGYVLGGPGFSSGLARGCVADA
jgi:DNA-binding response OmpR family regulator